MGFFLIPVALFAVSAAAGAKGAHDTVQANRTRQGAAERRRRAAALLKFQEDKTARAKELSKLRFGRLSLVRLSALEQRQSIVGWLRRGDINHLDGALPGRRLPDFDAWVNEGAAAKATLDDLVTSRTRGAVGMTLAAKAASTVGKAGTVQAVRTLSGAAAQRAALAWLGGGAVGAGGGGVALGTMVMGSLNIGLATFGVGLTAKKLASQYDEASREYEEQVQDALEQHKALRRNLGLVRLRSDALRRSLNSVAHRTQHLLQHSDPHRDEHAERLLHHGVALSRLVAAPVVDDEGALSDGWFDPDEVIQPLRLERRDDDFILEA